MMYKIFKLLKLYYENQVKLRTRVNKLTTI